MHSQSHLAFKQASPPGVNGLVVLRTMVEIVSPEAGDARRPHVYLPNLLLGDLDGVAGRAGLDRGAEE